ncbi:phosphate ABC transporter permease PstA [Opitutia bacterium ISCC 51]|nr:phosphate ABC transporter permease PstA [Opitutae bacterium ISCC 51]QXD27088.1 phosphate ABC transporter permease PstA [Opitutae bacterium ISCC 52]
MNTFAKKEKSSFPDEIAVWFSSLGLCLGLVMILGLLSVIAYNGITVFWPKRVAEIQLSSESVEDFSGREKAAGIIVSKQVVTNDRSLDTAIAPREEWQLFLGNKDVFGFSYKFFNRSEIHSVSYPEHVAVLERSEYGNAIVYPEHITTEEGETIEVDAEAFDEKLLEVVEICKQRRLDIRHLEQVEIGAINRKLEALRLSELKITLKSKMDERDSRALDNIKEERATLQSSFQVIAREARALRAIQDKSRLKYRLASGEEGEISGGDIFHLYFPNRLGFFGQCSIFFVQIREFLTTEPREANTEGGVFPAIFGTFVMTLIMSLAVVPFGVLAAIYLREYASDGFFVRSVRIAINNLAGVPSIVFGVFGLGFFVYFVGGSIDQLFYSLRLPTPTFGTGGIFWASLTLAIMTVPVVIVATEEALSSVSQGVRESSQACGASKWQTIQRIILPASAPGILTGMILAMARGAGEVAPLMMVGVVKVAPSLPIDGQFPFVHLERKFMHLGFHIYDLGFQSPDSEAALPMVFATTLLLIVLIVFLNFAAILLRNRLRRKYKTSTF